ncbi:P-loop containing nucleoside triphosphate hydrolase protein [Auriculariales sp. MPI-PUGE-AT-0066]|nr:P-loop containing nucleoside triphosphate hydrolase protein [Auriculariales sp. MPI-PUGE-AT-0066]
MFRQCPHVASECKCAFRCFHSPASLARQAQLVLATSMSSKYAKPLKATPITSSSQAGPSSRKPAQLQDQPSKRELKSVPAPMDFDSDDEFNPHSEVNKFETTKGKRKRTAVPGPSPAKRGGRRLANEKEPRRKFRETVPVQLKQFFGDIDSSDGEYRAPAKAGPVNPTPGQGAADESETEESEPEVNLNAESSETESESEPDASPAQPALPAKRKASPLASPSRNAKRARLNDADAAVDEQLEQHVRPAFKYTRAQGVAGGLAVSGDVVVPRPINRFLRAYQREGVEFFAERYALGRGGILADDMGLGKTIQVIAFLAAIMDKKNDKRDLRRREEFVRERDLAGITPRARVDVDAIRQWPTCLIVAPATLVGNWKRELETWGHFEFAVYLGPKRAEALRLYELGKLDILLTSVDIMRSDISKIQDLPFSCIFVDECHNAKETTSQTYQCLKSFRCQIRFGMTGTALQNAYEELWSILDFAVPDQLGTRDEWRRIVATPLRNGQKRDADPKERAVATRVAAALHSKVLPKHFLRREKHDPRIGLQLPRKIDKVVFCPLLPMQRTVYRRFLEFPAVQNMAKKDDPCDCGGKKRRGKCCHPFNKEDLFRFMDAILKISNHLVLILPDGKNLTKEQQNKAKELSSIAWPDGGVPRYAEVAFEPNYCGKWKVLVTLMREWRQDSTNKALIFTRSVRLLDFIAFNLDASDVSSVRLDGSTPQADRMGIVDQFNNDPTVFAFLISTLAGGTGLNLTSANKVVIFDPNWNPAHDMQAMDRAYRFGQTRDVEVFRLLSDGTLEENIYQRQVYKGHQAQIAYNNALPTRMFDGVQYSKQAPGELFGIKNIFALKEYADHTRTKYRIQRAELDGLEWALRNVEGTNSETPDWDFITASAEEMSKEIREQVQHDVDSLLHSSGVTFAVQHSELMRNDDLERIQKRHLKDPSFNAAAAEAKRLADGARKKSERERFRDTTGDEPDEASDLEVGDDDRFRSPGGRWRRMPPRYGADPSWPPKRKHHREPKHPRRRGGEGDKLGARKEALVKKGYIKSVDDFPSFAKVFATYPAEKQRDFVLSLDRL